MAGKTTTIGSLIITFLLGGAILISLSGQNVQFQFNKYDSVFSSKINDEWVVSGVEKNLLFDSAGKIIKPGKSTIVTAQEGDMFYVNRTVTFKNNISILDEYSFISSTSDITLFPLIHRITVVNGVGTTYYYQVSKLEIIPETSISEGNSVVFGKQMKVTFDTPDTITLKGSTLRLGYKITSNTFVVNNRLFDPPPTPLNALIYYSFDGGVSNSTQTNDTSNNNFHGSVRNATLILE